MSIASKITELSTDISNAYDAIETKGGTIPANKNTNNLDIAIESIPTGSQPTLITKNITANGDYNASDDNADGYSEVSVKTYEETPWGGWMADGDTHLWIKVDEYTRDLKYGLGLFVLDKTQPITIHWGDDTSDSATMPLNDRTLTRTFHTYEQPGHYRIDLVGGKFRFAGNSTSGGGSTIFGEGNSYEEALLYILYYCEFGTNIYSPNDMTFAFYKCYNLRNIYNSGGLNSMTSVPNNMFNGCQNLKKILPLTFITNIGQNAFSDAAKFGMNDALSLPNTIQSYGTGAFTASGIRNIEFEEPVNDATLARNMFSYANQLFRVNIPYGVKSIPSTFISYGVRLSGEIIMPNTISSFGNSAFDRCGWNYWNFKNFDSLNGMIVNNEGAAVSFGTNCLGSLNVDAKFVFANPEIAKIAENTTNLAVYANKIYGHIGLNETFDLINPFSSSVTVTSSDNSICSVSYANNIITFMGISKGTATITITSDIESTIYKVVVE